MIRHEIMVKRTKQEIDRLSEQMVETWLNAGSHANRDSLRARAIQLIFNCLPEARNDYQESRADG